MRRALVLLLPLLVGFDLLESPNKSVEEGNARMKTGKAEEALGQYDKAVKGLPGEPGVHFDRGAALFALSRFDEAAQEFLGATTAKTPALKESAFYNMGNALFKMDKYGDAIAAYRRALVLDPSDVKAKWNLELALKKKKDEDAKNKQKNDQQNNDKNGNNQKQDKNDQGKDDKQKSDQSQNDKKNENKNDKKDDQKNPQDKPDKNDNQNDKQQQAGQDKQDKQDKKDQNPGNEGTPPEAPQDMKDIEAVLDSLERSPKDLEQERARLRAVRRAPPAKDW
jgi:Ca-activated chloride channel family protein